MKRNVLLLAFVSFGLIMVSPCYGDYWAKTYNSNGSGSFAAMEQTGDGGFVAAGYTHGQDDADIWVMRLDSEGNVGSGNPGTWQKRYGPGGYMSDDYATAISPTSDGGYIVASETWSFGGGHNYDLWLLKLDADGNVGPAYPGTWQKIYGIQESAHWEGAHSVQQTTDGGYIVSGYTNSFPEPDSTAHVWLLKLDANGDSVWQKIYKTYGHDLFSTVRQTTDGGYILATGTFARGVEDLWVVKLDADGNVGPTYPGTWQKAYGGNSSDGVWIGRIVVQQTIEGGYIVVGETFSFAQAEEGYSDIWALKLDANGNVTWEKAFGANGRAEGALSVRQTGDEGYIVAGYTVPWGSEASGHDWLLLRLDASGGIVWQKIYGGNSYDKPRSVVETTEGDFVAAGYTQSFGYAGLLLKLNPDGEIPEGCRAAAPIECLVGGTEAVVTNTGVIPQETYVVPIATDVPVQDTSAQPTEVCPSQDIDVTPLHHDFGVVLLGTSRTATVTIANVGQRDLTVTDISFATGNGEDFQVTSAPALPVVLPPVILDPINGTTDVEITFTPSWARQYWGYLDITSDDPYEDEVRVEFIANVVEVPVADFAGNPTTGPEPLVVQFTDHSTGTVSSWLWDFGDFETSTEENPIHTYTTTGDYTVSLTVSGPGGEDTETKTEYIHVTEPTTDPVIDRLRPKRREPGQKTNIVGSNFGWGDPGDYVRIGAKELPYDHDRIIEWTPTNIKVKIPKKKYVKNECAWFQGLDERKVKVWVNVGGVDSNKKRLTLIKNPADCL